jgi:hypothetical protein
MQIFKMQAFSNGSLDSDFGQFQIMSRYTPACHSEPRYLFHRGACPEQCRREESDAGLHKGREIFNEFAKVQDLACIIHK